MTRTRLLTVVLVTAALPGCVAPEVCDDESLGGESFTSETLDGEQTFAEIGEEGSVRFRATLRGLPELWPAEHAVQGSHLGVLIQLDYLDGSGAGGATQMPRFNVRLESASAAMSDYGQDTPAFPPIGGVFLSVPLFRECYEKDDLNCCEYGSTECALDAWLSYRRLDGDPFPPVVLRWEATAHATVETCPLSKTPEITLEVTGP